MTIHRKLKDHSLPSGEYVLSATNDDGVYNVYLDGRGLISDFTRSEAALAFLGLRKILGKRTCGKLMRIKGFD